MRISESLHGAGALAYILGNIGTTIYLFVDSFQNSDAGVLGWIFVIIPVNIFLGSIWPIYWAILHWLPPLW